MEMSKQEILGGLYTIRGGLSLMSMETDKVMASAALLADPNKKIEEKEAELRDEKRHEDKLIKDKFGKKDISLGWYEKSQLKKGARKDAGENKFQKFMLGHAFWTILPFVLVMALLLGLSRGEGFGGIYEILIFANPLMFFLSIFLGIVAWGIVLGIAYLIASQILVKKALRDRKGNKIGYYKTIDKSIENSRKRQADLANKIKEVKESRRLLANRHDAIANQAREKTMAIKQVLNREYDSWLHESDWENVDLLIYYIETNRAENVKEALQLVDRQRQAEQLEATIRQVGSEIIGTINSAFERMGQALAACFSAISQQLSQMESNLMSQGDCMVKAIELQTALQVKANKKAVELLGDMKRNLKR